MNLVLVLTLISIFLGLFGPIGVAATIIAYRAAKQGERRVLRAIKEDLRPRNVVGWIERTIVPHVLPSHRLSQTPIDEQPAPKKVRPPREPGRPKRPWWKTPDNPSVPWWKTPETPSSPNHPLPRPGDPYPSHRPSAPPYSTRPEQSVTTDRPSRGPVMTRPDRSPVVTRPERGDFIRRG